MHRAGAPAVAGIDSIVPEGARSPSIYIFYSLACARAIFDSPRNAVVLPLNGQRSYDLPNHELLNRAGRRPRGARRKALSGRLGGSALNLVE